MMPKVWGWDSAIIPLGLPVATLAALSSFMLWKARRRIPEGHCQVCGYDLTGNESGRCSECGWVIDWSVAFANEELRRIGTPAHLAQGWRTIAAAMATVGLMLFRPVTFARRLRYDEGLWPAALAESTLQSETASARVALLLETASRTIQANQEQSSPGTINPRM